MEALSQLAWLLLNAGTFFTVMHYTARRHHALAPTDAAVRTRADSTVARDPVCGMAVAPSDDISWIQHGLTYYFCSLSCRSRFRNAPEQFLARRNGANPRHG